MKERQSASFWIEENVLFSPEGVWCFLTFRWENLEQCNFNFAKAQPLPGSLLCGHSLRLGMGILIPSTTWLLGFGVFKALFTGPAAASPVAL